MAKPEFAKVEIDHPDNNPIMIRLHENAVMGTWDVELIVGNFKYEHQANAAANKLIKLVERDLGSRKARLVRSN